MITAENRKRTKIVPISSLFSLIFGHKIISGYQTKISFSSSYASISDKVSIGTQGTPYLL